MIFHIVAQVNKAQSWTALFRAFSSHRQPSAIFSKVFPAEQASASLQAIKVCQLGQDVCSAGNTFEKIAEGCR